MITTLSVVLGVSLCAVWTLALLNERHPKYSNIWAANIEGGEAVAQRIARDLGYSYLGQLGHFKGYYELVREDHPEMSLRDSEHLTRSLLELDEVKWAAQQKLVRPTTHGWFSHSETSWNDHILTFLRQAILTERFKYLNSLGLCNPIFRCVMFSDKDKEYLEDNGQDHIETLGRFSTKPAPMYQLFTYSKDVTKPIGLESQKLSAYALNYFDPLWQMQWNLQDYRTYDMPVMDLNVVPVHNMGYTGKGVVVGVVDSGVEQDHPDLKTNLLTLLCYDYCKDIPGSQPVDDGHGTSCAGVIAMEPNNGYCGVGIAYNANIIGIRALCPKDQTESVTTKGLTHHKDKIDIYSNSWGFGTDGKDVFVLDHLEEEAYRDGALKGRGGKGVIFVRTSGNDKIIGDNCAVDATINIPYAIPIAGASHYGKTVSYSERCTAVFATAYTKEFGEEGIVAPSLKGTCVTTFSGTSAACPQASGVIALVLEANPELTYRDVMHLITMSAEVAPLANNKGIWYKNGRGFWVSNDFGFGLMNAENMVNLALHWENVPELHECVVEIELDEPVPLSPSVKARVPFTTTACAGSDDEVNYLEHVVLASTVEYPYRGNITVYLESPSGTVSQLLEPRSKDDDKDGLEGWGILTTHNWGEEPRGEWVVRYEIVSSISSVDSGASGAVKEFTLKLYGTREKPAHYLRKRQYAAFRLPDGQTS